VRIPWQCKALFAVTVWGASFVATKTALAEVGPFTIVGLRFGMGLAVLLATVAARGQMRAIGRRELGMFALLGCIGVLVHSLLQANGLRYTSAMHTGWLVGLIPVFTAILARIFLHERLSRLGVGGVLLAFAGALLVVGRGRLGPDVFRLPSTAGDALVLLSALNWAVFSVLAKPQLRTCPAALVMTWVVLLGWLMILPFCLATHAWRELPRLTPDGWIAILFLGFLCSGAAYVFWFDSLREAEASRVAAFLYLEPLVSLAVAAWLLHELVSPPALAGGSLILAGVWLVNRPARRSI
jgi:drug/metabolite transporter (DMT)-like permease